MTSLALAALTLVQAAGQEPSAGRLTISTGLLPAERTLAELAKATGTELRATPATADLPLMVRVTDADPKRVLAEVARVLGAEWKPEGNAFVLSSDSAYRRKLARETDARRAERIARKVADLDAATRTLRFDDAFATNIRKDGDRIFEGMMKSMAEGGADFNPAALFASPVFTQNPATKAVNAILATMDPKVLASLVPGERAVFALRPTRMQGVLPPKSRAALDAYAGDAAAHAQAMKNTASGEGFDFLGMMSGLSTSKGQGPVADAHLEIWPGDGMLTVGLHLFNAGGESVGQGFGFVDLSTPAPTVAPAGEPLKVTPLGREWGAKFRAASAGTTDLRNGPMAFGAMFGASGAGRTEALGKPMSAGLRAFLADPVANSLAAPLFEPVAAAIPGDLVATVPDSGLGLLASLAAEEASTGAAALAAIEAAPSFSITKDGTLTVVGAATPALLHREWADRRALRDLVTAMGRTGYLRLDDAARYATAQKSQAGAINVAGPIVTLLQGKAAFAFMGDPLLSEFETLRIYGSLTPAQRQTLAASRGVPFTALNGDAADALGRLLFDAPIGPMPSFEGSEEASDDSDTLWGAFNGMTRREAERTVRFAEGVPRDGFFTMTASEGTDLYRMTDSGSGATMFGDAGTLGFLRGAKDAPFFKNFVGGANYDRFTPAKSRTLNFKFVFGPKIASTRSLDDHEVTSTESLTFDRLPQKFRDEVEEGAKAAAMMKAPPGRIKP